MSKEVNTENQVEENKLVAERRAKLDKVREKGNAFPNSFRRTAYASELQQQYGETEKQILEEKGEVFSVAGRIMAMRGPFIVLQEMSGRIQAYVDKKKLSAELATDIKTWDIGDIIGVTGLLNKSGKGDLYIYITYAELLTKSLRPLPDKHKGLVDTESRYRQRYVDLIVNEQSRNVFITRSKIIEAIRQFMIQRDFLEVETPMMQVIPGGAAAKPFETYHNALDLPMYLRIAPELYLKRLTVGGMERVFEINRNFRNEGLSTRHNPEFTMLEFYWAYADYRDLMGLTEEMFRYVATTVLGSTTITYQGQVFDLAKPFSRISVFDSILHYNPDLSADDLTTLDSASRVANALGIPLKDSYGLGKIQIEIFEKTVEDRLEAPTFITHYPAEVSPLARRSDDNPFVTDRFEFFVGGREVANGFSELNDAEDQAQRFMAQVADKDAGDDEAMHYDADYITALEYGLPPTAGEGIGIDRLVMFLTDQSSIKDVLLFPHMRPQG